MDAGTDTRPSTGRKRDHLEPMPKSRVPSDAAVDRRDPARNLQVVLAAAGLLFFGWSWADFSGPFRVFVDLQLRLFGSYSEPAAGAGSAMALAAVVGLSMVLLVRAYPSLSGAAADTVVAIVLVVATMAALWQAWQLWQEAVAMPRLSDPVRVVDLGTLDNLGNAALPVGHVRVIGVPDRRRQIFNYSTGRRGKGSYWETWIPLVSRRQDDSNAPVRIVATSRGRDRNAADRAVADDPAGLLLFDSVDTRTIYEARQDGLDMSERSFALYADEEVRSDKFTNAALLTFLVAVCWGFAAYGRIAGRKGGRTPKLSPPARTTDAEPAPAVSTFAASASRPPEAARTADAMLKRVASASAVAALLAACVLWEVFGFFPSGAALAGYAAAAITFGVSLLLRWLGQRLEGTKPDVHPRPASIATPAALTPPAGAALLCVLRDEPNFSSTSYKRVDVDGQRVADLKANRYTVVALSPGPHTLAVNTRISLTRDIVARFEVAAGEVVAYRLHIPFFAPMWLERTPDIAGVRAALPRLKPADSP